MPFPYLQLAESNWVRSGLLLAGCTEGVMGKGRAKTV
jgi:hypothetical protein